MTIKISGGGLITIQIVLIILKLTNVIDWSWWLVLAPALLPVALVVLVLLTVIVALALGVSVGEEE
jgi:hypothetical protein